MLLFILKYMLNDINLVMRILNFTYVKQKDLSTSYRTVLVTEDTDKYLLGYDMSNLDPELHEELAARATVLKDEFNMRLQLLAKEYDLVHDYRRFLKSGIVNGSLV